MGSYPVPFKRKLFFYYYERKWLLQTKKWDLQKARIFFQLFLGLQMTYSCKALVFDLAIEVHNRTFTTDWFDNSDAFPFYTNQMLYLHSNTPPKNAYGSIDPEILRYTRIATDLTDIVTHVYLLLIRMKKQDSECTGII